MNSTTQAATKKMPALRKGDSGLAVKVLQRLLIAQGYDFTNNLKVDGVFGLKTEEAVAALQKRRSLTVDGVVGDNTWISLSELF